MIRCSGLERNSSIAASSASRPTASRAGTLTLASRRAAPLRPTRPACRFSMQRPRSVVAGARASQACALLGEIRVRRRFPAKASRLLRDAEGIGRARGSSRTASRAARCCSRRTLSRTRRRRPATLRGTTTATPWTSRSQRRGVANFSRGGVASRANPQPEESSGSEVRRGFGSAVSSTSVSVVLVDGDSSSSSGFATVSFTGMG